MPDKQSVAEVEVFRPVLTSYAYNILGSYDEAKDVVQDTYLQYITIDTSHIDNIRGYLTRMVINRSINCKNRQKKALRVYPGEWLPEPVSTDTADAGISKKEILSYSLMVLLEKLNAKQRAVFILKEAFDYEHAEIGAIIGISEENSRQLLSRAKRHLQNQATGKRNSADAAESLNKYLQLIQRGDIQRLEELLHRDVTMISDGGGKATAALNPLTGRSPVLAFLNGIYTKFYQDKPIHLGQVNHQPALFYFNEGLLTACQIYIFENGLINHIYIIRNPDKLDQLQKSILNCHAAKLSIVIT